MRRKLAAGNWKMHGSLAAMREIETLSAAHGKASVDIVICPPAPLLLPARAAASSPTIQIGAQDCHANPEGAHTGDIAAPLLADLGARYVILGHSERRADHGETNADVEAKARAAHAAGLTAILCVGEAEADRLAGRTLDIIAEQLQGSLPDEIAGANTVIAYEPIWAIGTGRVPTPEQISEVHDFIRAQLTDRFGAEIADGIRLLYGGSVKPSNAAEIFQISNVDGALVGGASLKADEFSTIITALESTV
jgi:triosephosphate isomerase